MFTLETGAGWWNPVLFALATLVVFLVVYILRGAGRSGADQSGEKGKVFLSGNPEEEYEEQHRIKASNLYWGFTASMRTFYGVLRRGHSGIASDYVLWFLLIIVLFFLVVGVL